jgi:Leucine-rich repeat (LRR) protein
MGLLLVTDDHNQPKASRPSPYRHINLLLLDTVTALSSLTELSIQGEISVKLLHTLIGSAEHLSFTCEQQIPDQLKITMAQKTGSIQPLHLIKTLVIERFNYGAREAPFSCQSFSSFPCLTELKLINLSIREIPQDIDCLLSLRKMDLTGNDFVHLPKTMAQLTKLECLTLRNCRQLKALPLLTPTLTLPGLDNQPRGLIELCIDNCKNLQSLQDQLLCYNTSLAYLDLSNHDFERIPTSIRHLSSLNTLCLKNCKKLKYVEELPLSLNHLYAHGCDYLENVTLSPNHTIKHLDLRDCPRLKQSEQIKTLVSNERHGEAVSFLLSTRYFVMPLLY